MGDRGAGHEPYGHVTFDIGNIHSFTHRFFLSSPPRLPTASLSASWRGLEALLFSFDGYDMSGRTSEMAVAKLQISMSILSLLVRPRIRSFMEAASLAPLPTGSPHEAKLLDCESWYELVRSRHF